MNHSTTIAQALNVSPAQVNTTIELLDAGNTLPFIARYRKEMTGGLDEDQIRRLQEQLAHLRALDERRQTILNSIEEQGKLTPELSAQLTAAQSLNELEDLYLPYRPKRRTRAEIAREKGLAGLADLILQQARLRQTETQIAAPYITADVPTVDAAFAGARDIVAEAISDHARIRGGVREKALKWGLLRSEKIAEAADEKNVYATYYTYEARIDRVQPYQVLAINRGESEKVLRVKVEVAERDWLTPIHAVYRPDPRSPLAGQLELAITDAAKRLLLPAIERDVRATLTEQAETHAIQVFALNLRGLLNQPPLTGHVVMGLDPAYRTGCKVAVIDATGKVLATDTVYPHEPQRRWGEAKQSLQRLISTHHVTLIAIGNGTASRETEQLAAELTDADRHYLMVNEAGASVYSASPLARAELPDLDVTLRGAVSIARRALDPLAELVKIEPKAIGVGLYQHDVNQKQLADKLDAVVEATVNRVGVDVNTASVALLTHVAGIGPKLAERIIEYRDREGVFNSRVELKQIAGLGPKAFEQAAGFLRVRAGKNPLDASAIHPESYAIATAVLERAGLNLKTPPAERAEPLNALLQRYTVAQLAAELGTGVPTLTDILEQLVRPGRDPREDLPAPILRSDVLSVEALQTGMRLNGTVRNVVDFGVFIDIGVKQDGLLHRSQIPRGHSLSVGDVLEVEILNVERERGRISLGWVK
ncbi:MAG: RNA-binding transcriptional accessory protein [Chloroflexi bacterium]|uniref:Tex family protein n=1 Tax=Candidatus Flexifilum breve TaxID=3140694 RepID=UPI0031348000|nr:RNA-binding transcriptional accessory protein [Chloroflexota bacterium]